jgi:hypothetical protein
MRSKVALRAALALATLALAAAQAVPAAEAPPAPRPLVRRVDALRPFTRVALCAPLNLVVAPSRPGDARAYAYSLTVEAERAALDGVRGAVSRDGVLEITAAGPLETARPIKVTAALPPDALAGVSHGGPAADVFLAPGFDVAELALESALGAGALYANGATAARLNVAASGAGDLVARGGAFGAVSAAADGAGALYLSGVRDRVELRLGGVARAVVDQGANSTITGFAAGLNRVAFAAGACDVRSAFFASALFPVCQPQAFVAPPAPAPTWSCGVRVNGTFNCRPGVVLSAARAGAALSGAGGAAAQAPPRGFAFQEGGAAQAGRAAPGAASGAARAAGAGPQSASASSVAGPGGATTTTTTTSGGQTRTNTAGSGTLTADAAPSAAPGVAKAYGGGEVATAESVPCAAPPAETRVALG